MSLQMTVYAVSLSRLGGVVLSRDQTILDAMRAEEEARGESYLSEPVTDEDDYDQDDDDGSEVERVDPLDGLTWWDVMTDLVYGTFRADVPPAVYVQGFEIVCGRFGRELDAPEPMIRASEYICHVDETLKRRGVSVGLEDLFYLGGAPFKLPDTDSEYPYIGHMRTKAIAQALEQLAQLDVSDLEYDVVKFVPMIRAWYEEAALLSDGCLVGFLG